jgi:hypothetical protein
MAERWKTLIKSEIKSRLYMALLGQKRGINAFALSSKFDGPGRKKYARPYVEVTLKEMEREKTLVSEEFREEGKRPISLYRADPDVYIEFLRESVEIDEKGLTEIKKLVLDPDLSTPLNEMAYLDLPMGIDALSDISLYYFFVKELVTKGILPKDELRSHGFPPKFIHLYSDFVYPRLAAIPKPKLDEKKIELLKKYEPTFFTAILSASILFMMETKKGRSSPPTGWKEFTRIMGIETQRR